MVIDSKKTESKLKVNMGNGGIKKIPHIENVEDGSSRLKKTTGGKGGLKIDGSISKPGPIDKSLPKPAPYPLHSLSPRKTESLSTEDIEIEAADMQSAPQKFDWISVVFQPLGALLAIVTILVILHVTGSGMSMGLYMLIGSLTGVLGILWGVIRYRSQQKQAKADVTVNEKLYREKLRKYEEQLSEAARAQLRVMSDAAPGVTVCAKLKEGSPMLWSHSFESSDFMTLRLGTGATELLRKIKVPEKRYSENNYLNDEARDLAKKYENIEDAPICCELRKTSSLGVVGERGAVIRQAMSLIVEAAAMHSYEDLKIVLLYPEAEAELWSPARFLPHVFDNEREQRYIAEDREQAIELLKSVEAVLEKRKEAQNTYGYSSDTVSYPHFMVIVADTSYLSGSSYGKMLCTGDESLEISSVFLANRIDRLPQQCKMIAEIKDGSRKSKFYDRAKSNEALFYEPETINEPQWKMFISTLAPIRLENPTAAKNIPRSLSFFEAYGITKPEEIDLKKMWDKGHPEISMAAKLGVGKGGGTLNFDIHPNKSGTHGIFVGGTGSGKTTMVRAWVLSMAATFSPERVNFVLVDFREPGLLHSLNRLPHVVGTVGRLDVDIERNLTALNSEISRRKRLLAHADANDIDNYLGKHYAGEPLAEEPLAFLFIVIDELNEFRMWTRDGAGDDWMNLLDSLYQTGRALGIHVISGSQTPRPFTDVMRQNAKFRWCLRTNEPGDSKDILGNDNAFGLKIKGRCFISVGGEIEEIQPMYADKPYYTPVELSEIPECEMALVSLTGERKTVGKKKGNRPSELEIMVDHICSFAEKSGIKLPDKIWPNPLPEKVMLDELPEPDVNMLSSIVGLVDDPHQQAQYPLEIQLEKTGCFLAYGATQTGKTTFLQSFAASLMDNNSPKVLEMYIVESANGDFDGFEAYPHIQKIIDNSSADEVIREVDSILSKRRKARRDKTAKRIVVLVDNLNGIISDNRTEILNIVQNGPGQGIYLVASATQAGGAQSVYSVETLLKTGYSFWISENIHDYTNPIHSKAVKSVPPSNIPGRGITDVGRVVSYQTAMLAAEEERNQLPEIIRKRALSRWGKVKRAEKELRESLEEGVVLLGYSHERNDAIKHNFKNNTSLLVLGDDYAERQQVLKAVAKQLRETVGQAVFIGVDLEEGFWNDISGMSFLCSGPPLDGYLEQMRDELVERNKNPNINYPPYIFLFESIKDSIKACSEASLNRIDKNLLLNASKYSVFFVAGCSYEDFDQMYAEEENLIAQSNGSGKDIVPITRAAVGRSLLLNAEANKINPFFRARYTFDGDETYYLSSGKAEAINPVLGKGGEG